LRLEASHLLVIEEILFDDRYGGEDLGVLVTPVGLKVLEAHSLLTMNEDYKANPISPNRRHDDSRVDLL